MIDEETGLYYMNARYYEPATGRFTSQDSFRGEGEAFWHLYLYCDSDPVNFTDPTGHAKKKIRTLYAKKKEKRYLKMWNKGIALVRTFTFNVEITIKMHTVAASIRQIDEITILSSVDKFMFNQSYYPSLKIFKMNNLKVGKKTIGRSSLNKKRSQILTSNRSTKKSDFQCYQPKNLRVIGRSRITFNFAFYYDNNRYDSYATTKAQYYKMDF